MSQERMSGQPSVTPILPTLPPLWDELRAYALPGGLLTRLGREQRWTPAFTQRAAQEYRRFLLLSTLGAPVTPPAAVDEVWHLHLLFTRDYWERLTPLLPAPLHHEPGAGQPGDAARFRAQYEATLDAYARTFGERPPADIWPDPRPSRIERAQQGHVQGSARRAGLWLAVGAALIAGLTFAWSHYALLLALGVGLTVLLLTWLAGLPSRPTPRAGGGADGGFSFPLVFSDTSSSSTCTPSDSGLSGSDGSCGDSGGGSSCGSSCGGGCSS